MVGWRGIRAWSRKAELAAYLMAAAYLPPELEAIVGYSAAIER